MGQRAAATEVKFRPGSPSTLGEKVASGLVWRFSTIDCVSDNLDYFEDGFGNSDSFLDVGARSAVQIRKHPRQGSHPLHASM
jgi:hypothetical protein